MLWAVRYGEYQILGSTFYRGISNRVQNLPKNCILKSILSSISWLFFLSFFEVWWHHFRKISIRDFGMNFISCFCVIQMINALQILFYSQVPFSSCGSLLQRRQVQPVHISCVSRYFQQYKQNAGSFSAL